MENYVARDSQWEFINDIYATESWLDLKCMPINLADWKGMTTIKNQVNIYALIVYYIIRVQANIYALIVYYMIRKGVQMEYESSLYYPQY